MWEEAGKRLGKSGKGSERVDCVRFRGREEERRWSSEMRIGGGGSGLGRRRSWERILLLEHYVSSE
jgi:hypothetical protein